MKKKTEVYILSGFLGSGKTTLLKNIIEDEKRLGRRLAVMMNELGKVSIDSDAVTNDIALKELLDGCICCTIQDKLESQLQGLLLDEKPEVIYIETTGAAHPVEVLDAILSPLFADKIEVKGIVTVVDGLQWLKRKEYSPQIQQLFIEQVRHADLILLNKADRLTDAEQGKLVMDIQGFNPLATSILTSFAKISLKQIQRMSFNEKEDRIRTSIGEHLHLSTYVYQFSQPIDLEAFERFLTTLPDTLYRMKGYIRFTHSTFPYLF